MRPNLMAVDESRIAADAELTRSLNQGCPVLTKGQSYSGIL
jgi:hypothetical protein